MADDFEFDSHPSTGLLTGEPVHRPAQCADMGGNDLSRAKQHPVSMRCSQAYRGRSIVKKLPVGAIVLLGVAVFALVFSMVFAYRWYEVNSQADRTYSNGQCHVPWPDPPGDEGCRRNAQLHRRNAERDLRYALAGFVVALVAGGSALLVVRQSAEQEPTTNKPGARASTTTADRLIELQRLKDAGLLTDAEYDQKRRRLVDDI